MARNVGVMLCVLLSVARVAGAGADDPPSPPVWPGRFHAMMSQVREGDYGVVDLWYDYAAGRNLNIIQTQGGEEDGPLFDNERANGTTYYYHPAKAKAKYCNTVDFGVGIIKPDWLKGATYLGEEKCGIYECHKWEQGEIPEAHARFLGLQDGSFAEFSTRKKQEEAVGRSLYTSAAMADGSSPSLRGGEAETEDSGEGAQKQGGKRDRFITYWSEKDSNRPVKWVFFNDAYFQVIRFDEGATMPDKMFQIPAYCFEEMHE
eukprot:g8667.t2